MTEFVLVLSTAQVGGGDWIARSLVEEKLAACVNIARVRSYFIWDGKLSDENEDLMIIKTESRLVDRVKSRIKELHSYQLPEIIIIPILDGEENYLHWIRQALG
jgi:periplasmic divalent cation tolerance protein